MSYVNKNLLTGEIVFVVSRMSWWTAFWPIVIGIFLGMFTLVGVVVMIPAIVRVLTTEVAITNRRIIFKKGFISRDVMKLELSRVEALEFTQGISERLLRYGDITLAGAGNRMKVVGIVNPKEFTTQFYNTLYSKS